MRSQHTRHEGALVVFEVHPIQRHGARPSLCPKRVQDDGQTRSVVEERLRPGRVAVRAEQLIAVDAFLRAASQAIEAMRKQLLAAKLAVPPTPNAATLLPAFQVYADRARRLLLQPGSKKRCEPVAACWIPDGHSGLPQRS